ncbi:serine hydrolase domain-containing protein [Cytobacillus sp. IB215665]|uniref:serine hydrolase domain-containing protein n=1 Tax=Cytobacillus sp. IB215665 TaxID=3097357 RepID=UPI002A0C3335|nr:serine hydrolase domain-containing protein [Cytobacillus sp. IB215665]MDX8365619.1 serine hydrolase domain-containing protein [Cytobacillus sp. IB215665]
MLNTMTHKLIKKELDSAKKASLAVGVVSPKGKFTDGQFYHELNEREIGNCIFEIGSTTKTFTSFLLAKLVQESKISLDEPISSYKPAYKNALSYDGKDITFRHLSTHSSRLPREDMKKLRKRIKENKQDKDNFYKHYTHEDLHQFFIDFDLKKEIGAKWGYSNIGIGLLGNVLAEIVGMTYEEAIKTHILHPLNMKDTFITGNEEQMKRYVQTYNKKGVMIPPIELPSIQGAGAFKSTLNDMLIYLEHQMGMKESSLKEAIELTHEIHGNSSKKSMQMGLGWFIEQKKWSPSPIIHHGGTTLGFHTYCGFLKEEQIGIVVFSTIQLTTTRIIKILLKLTGLINEDIAESIYLEHLA